PNKWRGCPARTPASFSRPSSLSGGPMHMRVSNKRTNNHENTKDTKTTRIFRDFRAFRAFVVAFWLVSASLTLFALQHTLEDVAAGLRARDVATRLRAVQILRDAGYPEAA